MSEIVALPRLACAVLASSSRHDSLITTPRTELWIPITYIYIGICLVVKSSPSHYLRYPSVENVCILYLNTNRECPHFLVITTHSPSCPYSSGATLSPRRLTLTVEVSGEDHDVAGALHLATNCVCHRTYTLENSEGTIVEVQVEKAYVCSAIRESESSNLGVDRSEAGPSIFLLACVATQLLQVLLNGILPALLHT